MKRILLAVFLLLGVCGAATAETQSTAFTYQGNLTADGAPANGNFDLTFTLFDAPTGGNPVGTPIAINAFPVVNGRFATDLDFPTAFAGQQRWLEVSVGAQILSPRQPVNSVPISQFAISSVPKLVNGQFLPTQLVYGAVVTCASTATSGGLSTCNTMLIDGINANLAPSVANAVCNAVTSKGYDNASGPGLVSAPFFNFTNGAWVLATTGQVSPMQNLSCDR